MKLFLFYNNYNVVVIILLCFMLQQTIYDVNGFLISHEIRSSRILTRNHHHHYDSICTTTTTKIRPTPSTAMRISNRRRINSIITTTTNQNMITYNQNQVNNDKNHVKSLNALTLFATASGSNNENPSSESESLNRRQVIELAIGSTGIGISILGTREIDPTDYGLWGILPIGTYKQKKTILETIIPNQIWTLEQKFGILNVQVPLRMTIIKLNSGGLLVYNPIAATPECIDYIRQIEYETKSYVKYIVVGSVALEHKVYGGVFAQKFPKATVYLTPGQYSYPIALSEPLLGYPIGRTKMIPFDTTNMNDDPNSIIPNEWKNELLFETLGPIISRDGAFSETVFYHIPSKTLLVTDTAVQVSDVVPAIYNTDTKPLLYHARTTVTDIIIDTPETRKIGWKRLLLFALYFTPSSIMIKDLDIAIKERRPDINSDFLGIYPWDWSNGIDEQQSWNSIKGSLKNKPFVAPILQVLLLNRNPVEVYDFAKKVGTWDFNRIIPAHLQNNIRCNGNDYMNSFLFITEQGVPNGYPKPLQRDLQLLLDSEINLIDSGAIIKSPPKLGGKYTRQEILNQTTYQCRQNICTPKANDVASSS